MIPQVHVTREPSGPTGRMVPQVYVTRKPLGPTCQIEMGKVPKVHVTHERSGPTGRMEKGSTYICVMDKGPSEYIMTNYKRHG